jgi:hypothetical protein
VTSPKYHSDTIRLGHTDSRNAQPKKSVEFEMASITTTTPTGFANVSRAVVAAAAELVAGVERTLLGDGRMVTAQGNAWAAIEADRARNQARHDMDEMVSALTGHR